jgi:hypothetical protein
MPDTALGIPPDAADETPAQSNPLPRIIPRPRIIEFGVKSSFQEMAPIEIALG